MCDFGGGVDSQAQAAIAGANARANEALAAAKQAAGAATELLVRPEDSEAARRASEAAQKRIRDGRGLVPSPIENAPIATQVLMGR